MLFFYKCAILIQYTDLDSDQVLCWRLLLKEFYLTILHIQGSKDIVADAPSRLEIIDNKSNRVTTSAEANAHP